MSSRGEMKMSLRLMTCRLKSDYVLMVEVFFLATETYILMPQVLQKLQLAVGTLGQDGGTEGLHDLLDSNSLTCQLILCRADKAKCSLQPLLVTLEDHTDPVHLPFPLGRGLYS